jgi:hypothetical protein
VDSNLNPNLNYDFLLIMAGRQVPAFISFTLAVRSGGN